MARSINRVTFIGNLGDSPELTFVSGDSVVCNFPLALDDSYEKDGETVEQTVWVQVEAWDRLGEICEEYLDRGSQVYLEGKLVSSTWEDSDGNTRYSTEIHADRVDFLGGDTERRGQQKQRQEPSNGTPQAQEPEEQESFEPDSDLPF